MIETLSSKNRLFSEPPLITKKISYMVSPQTLLTYFFLPQHLGDNASVLQDIIDGKHPFSKTLSEAKRPMIVVGSGALQRDDGSTIHGLVASLAQKTRVASQAEDGWKILNVLHRVSRLETRHVA